MGLLQLSNHVIQKSPYWRANDALGHVKEIHQIWILFVEHVPVRHLLSSMAIFVPRDCSAAKGSLLYEIPLLRIVPKPGSLVLICTISQCNNPFLNLLFPMFCSTERVPWLFHPTLLNSMRKNTKVIGLMVKWQVMAKWGELVGLLFSCCFNPTLTPRYKLNFDQHYKV